ncbi:hypothetical protein [Pontibacter harenae]|uniref:hypothetical protein n=1 Tax=Pontibacter harenae TaxID=2894083 RepID=UPI001E4A03C1|nr:hypothetical protein [Pontibacter harenae]
MEELSKAIGARLLIQFSYSGETFVVEPHLLGKNKNNQDCLCAWQIETAGAESATNQWKCFLLNDMQNLVLLEQRFCKKRPGYDPYDNSMTRIYYRI